MLNKKVPIGDLIVVFGEKTVTNDQLPVATSARCGLVMQSDYYQDGRISKRDNIGSNISPNGSVTYRNRSDDGTFHFNVNNMGQDVCVSKFYPVFFVKDTVADRDYLVAKMNNLQRSFAELAVGTSQKVLSLTLLKSIKIDLPPIEKQREIAATLSTWDRAIELHDKLIALKEKQKQGLMQVLLTGKKRLLDDDGVPFSGEWISILLGELGSAYSGLSGKSKDDFGEGSPYIPYVNIFKNQTVDTNCLELVRISPDEKQNKVMFGDILFTTSSETIDEVGMSSVYLGRDSNDVHLNSFCFGFRLNSFNVLDPEFAAYLFRCQRVRHKISLCGQGSTRYNLSKKSFFRIHLDIPPIFEQKRIAKILSASTSEIDALKKKRNLLKQQKNGLMQQLLG